MMASEQGHYRSTVSLAHFLCDTRHPRSTQRYTFFRPMRHSGRGEVKLRHVEEINRC